MMLGMMMRDIKFGIRMLAKSPAFTATAILLLAVGIGANTLIFSVIDALLLRPLPVLHPENLVRVIEIHPNDFVTWDFPYDFCTAAPFADPDISESICQGEIDAAFSDGTAVDRVRVHLVSPNFFSTLGVQPHIGRVLNADDERDHAARAVLGYGFWQRRFQGDSAVIGRSINLGGHAFTIVGVTPEAFNGLAVDTSPDIRVPASVDRLLLRVTDDFNPGARPLFGQVFARLRDSVSLGQENAISDQLLGPAYQAELDKIYPREIARAGTSHLRLESAANGVSALRGQFSSGLELLMTGVALLLLMACANLAGLLLARSTARSSEFAIRLALGAGRRRIITQLLIEGFLLASAGGIAAINLSVFLMPLLLRVLPPVRDRAAVLQPVTVHVTLDIRILGFAIGVTFLTAILFTLSPALRAARAGIAEALNAARTASRRTFTRNVIVAAQVAMCTLMLIGAALLLATFDRMRSMNAGFDRDHVVTFTIDPDLRNYKPDQVRALAKSLLEKTNSLSGVDAASIATRALMRGTGLKSTFAAAGTRVTEPDFMGSSLNRVTPGYFQSMGMTLLAGRDFNEFDRIPAKPKRVIVNQAFARRYFPGRSPLGERFGYADKSGVARADNEIIGVVSDAKYRSLRETIPPTVYDSAAGGPDSAFVLHIRTRQDPASMIAPVREVLRSLDPEMPVLEAVTLRAEVETSLWQERLLAWLAAAFAAISALLASIGLYGALDYAVKLRTREIGIRTALGARPRSIAAMLSRETIVVVFTGVVAGLVAYGAATSWIGRVLYGVRAWEPFALISALSVIAAIGALAAVTPVIRAMRINPASALRAE